MENSLERMAGCSSKAATIASAVVWSRHLLDWNAAVFVVREPLRQRHCDLRRILVFAAA
jgi:hypothetical protein